MDTCGVNLVRQLVNNTGRGFLLNATAARLDCGKWEVEWILTPAAGHIRFIDARPWWKRFWSWIDRNRRPETFDLKG